MNRARLYPHGAPGIVRDLLLASSVVCDSIEAERVLAWAQGHPARVADPAGLTVEDSDG